MSAIVQNQPRGWEQFIGDRLTRKRLCVFALATIVVCAVLLVISFATAVDNRTRSGLGLGADYLAFHNAGTILNTHGGNRLYDLGLQSKLYHDNLPGEAPEASLPFAYAPFIALIFQPLARMSYAWSYAAWIAVSIALFIGAFALIWKAARLPMKWFGIALLCAISFEPFLIENLHGGQITTIGLISICAAIHLSTTSRPFRAGCCLALCAYKPTLLPLIIPMLVIMRQWRILAGFISGSIALALTSIAFLGTHACGDYVRLLLNYVDKTSSSAGGFQTWKFIDLNSALKLIGITPAIACAMLAVLGGGVLYRVIKIRPKTQADAVRMLPIAWATAIAWTLVLNIYVGVYDAILIIPAIVLVAGEMLRARGEIPLRFRCILVAIWIAPWFSGLLARETGFQFFTFILAGFAVNLLNQLTTRRDAAPREPRLDGELIPGHFVTPKARASC